MLSELYELDASNGWVPHFQKINWMAKENASPQKIAKAPENRLFNRYRDVLPYDHSRVVLKEGETDYINANLVEVPSVNERYILTQGPLKNTSLHFWQMVWEQNSQAIIMLNRVIEKNQIKCHQYWPCGEKVGHTNVLEFGCFRITYIEETMSEFFTVRTLEIFNMKEEEKRNIFHFHYLHWPDFGVPSSPASFLSFLFEVRNAGVLSSDVGPSIIHCSAGIGRSGTFIMVDSILKEVEQTRDLNAIDVKTAVLKIRRYRVGLIQTPDQLRFTYAAILEGTRLLMPQLYEEALEKFSNERAHEEEEEEVSEEDEVPPPVPVRKRQELDQTVDKEANIAPKRKRSLPDIPTESTSAAAETPKETSAAATADISKGVPSYQGFQADNISSDESDGEDEIIDLSESSTSSSSLAGEESEEDRERLYSKEDLTPEQDDQRYSKASGEKDIEDEEGSIETEVSHKTEEEEIKMEENEELQAEVEVQEDFTKIKPEVSQEGKTFPIEKEYKITHETTIPRKEMDSWMVEREEMQGKIEDKKEFATKTEETANTGNAKDTEVRKEREKKIDAGVYRTARKEIESRMHEPEDFYDRLEDREVFAKATEETTWQGKAKDTEVRKERETKIDEGKSRAVITEMESRMDEPEDFYDRLEDREVFAKTTAEETSWSSKARDTEVRKERETKIDAGKSRVVITEIESRMDEQEDFYDRLQDREVFAKTTEETTWQGKAKDTEVRKEREKKIDEGKSRAVITEMEGRMDEPEDFYDGLEDREVFANTTAEETSWSSKARDTEVRKEREMKMDAGKCRVVITEMESRMDETEDFYDRLEDREVFAKTTAEETSWSSKARDTEVRKERETKIDAGKCRVVITEMESRMDEPEDFYDRLEDREEFAKTTEETTWQGKAKDTEVRKEREKKMDVEKFRVVITEMESRMDEPEDFYDRLEDREEFAKTTEETTWQGKAKDTEVRREREKKMDVEKSRVVITEMESRMDEPEDFYDRLADREVFAKTPGEETSWSSKPKDSEVRKEREKNIDVGKSRAFRKEMESRMDETEDFYDRLEDREEFAKTTEETTWQGKAKDTEVRKEREKKMDVEKSRAVITEMESRMDEPEDFYDRLEDREEFAKTTEETTWQGKAKDTEVRKEREKKMDTGKSGAVITEMESRMDEPEDFYDRLEDREVFTKTTAEETSWSRKARDTEVRKEREMKMDAGKSGGVITELESRMDEPEDFYDRLEDREEFAKTTEETTWQGKAKDTEVRKEREKKMDAGKSRAVITEMESRMDETEDFYDRLEDREVFAKTTAEETSWSSKARDTEVRKERETKIDAGKCRVVITEMESRMDEPEDFYDRLEDREEFAKTTEETTWQGKAKDTEVRKEREKKMDVEKFRVVITEMESRMDEPEDFYDRLEDREEFAKTTEETTWQGKAKDTEVRREREKKMDVEKSRVVITEMESRMDEPEDFYDRLADREVFAKTPGEETSWSSKPKDSEVRKEREKNIDVGKSRAFRKEMESGMDETEDFYDRLEDREEFAKTTEETTWQGKAKDTEVRKEREKKMDVEKSRAVITEMESRMDEPEDFYDRLEDREEFAKTTEETTWQGKAKDTEVRKEREKKMDTGKSGAVITEMESRMDEPEDFYDRLEDREVFTKTTAEETSWSRKARDTEVRKEREMKMDAGKSGGVITEMESRMDEPEDFYDRLEDREEFAKTTEETTWQGKAKDTEVRKEREKKMDVEKCRVVITEMESRMDEPEDFYDRLEDREEFAKTTEETTWQGKAKDAEVRKEREKKMDAGKSGAVIIEMESRMDEPEDFYDRLEDREEFAKTTEETTWQGKAKDTEVRKEREKKMDVEKSRAVITEMESRMDEPEDFYDRLEDREVFTKTTAEETSWSSKARDTEVRKEIEMKMDAGKSGAVITEMESRMDETEDFYDRLEDREEFAKTTEETTWQGKAKDTEVRKEREKKMDIEKSRDVITEMESRMDEPEDFYDRLADREVFAKTPAEETSWSSKPKDSEVRKEREKNIDVGKSRAFRKEMESGMDETEDFYDRLQDREVFAKTTEETTWQGKANDKEVRKEGGKTLDAGVSRTVRRDTESRMDEIEDFQDRLQDRENFTETIKNVPELLEAGKRMPRIEKEKVTEMAIQTSTPFMMEDFKIDIDKEKLSSEDRETEEEVLVSKETIGIQAGTLETEYIEVVIDREGDRKMEGKEKPSKLDNLFQEETLISKENIERITEKEKAKEVIASAIETQSSVEQESDFKRQAFVLDKSENVVKTEDKPSKPVIEGGKINLTGPALVLEKMNAFKIQNRAVSKPLPEPMESGSDIRESGHGAYARITKAEKIIRPRNEPSNESIGGSIGTNPRKSDPKIQSKKLESDTKSPDDNLQPSTSKESMTEVRRRQRQEKKEKTEKLVKDIKARVEYEENTRWIRKIIRNSLIVIGICATAYIAYRCYRYFSHIPRRKPRRF